MTTNWSDAAGRLEQAEQERRVQGRAAAEQNRKVRAAQQRAKQEEQEDVREATVQLREFVASDDYQVALRLLKASSQLISLGDIQYERSPSWSHSSGVTKEGPQSTMRYYLNRDGFTACLDSWHATYHGDFEHSDNDPVPASLEEVALVAIRHGKKPVVAYIRARLDEIAAKAK